MDKMKDGSPTFLQALELDEKDDRAWHETIC
jgi:hypothetical protein